MLGLYWLRVLSNVFMFSVIAQGMNLMAGYTGYPAFGNVVFFGLGGYTTAVLMGKLQFSFAASVLAATAFCALFALALAAPLLRLKGHYFAIATLGLNEFTREIVANSALTGGGMGISLPMPPWAPAASAAMFYYLLLGAMAASLWITHEFARRRIGLACRAIRDNEVKAEASGLHTLRYKSAAWMLSAAMTGFIGAVNAFWLSYIDPASMFDIAIAVKAFVIVLLGGAGTVFGPVLGAFVVELLATLTWSALLNWHLGALGLLIMLVIVLSPGGLGPASGNARSRPTWLRRLLAYAPGERRKGNGLSKAR
jgi:branched-chain amino acid transport system permease protein